MKDFENFDSMKVDANWREGFESCVLEERAEALFKDC